MVRGKGPRGMKAIAETIVLHVAPPSPTAGPSPQRGGQIGAGSSELRA